MVGKYVITDVILTTSVTDNYEDFPPTLVHPVLASL